MSARDMKFFSVNILAACLVTSLLAAYASAQTAPAYRSGGTAAANNGKPLVIGGLSEQNDIKLLVNKSVVLTTSRPYRRLTIGQPDIFAANAIGPTKIFVSATQAG